MLRLSRDLDAKILISASEMAAIGRRAAIVLAQCPNGYTVPQLGFERVQRAEPFLPIALPIEVLWCER